MTDHEIPAGTDAEGWAGVARFVPYVSDEPRAAAHVCTYLIDSPVWHPLWAQYALSVIRLDDLPGLPPAKRKFDGATHEILVMALNPDERQTVDTMLEHSANGTLPFLLPVNIAEQFEATDEEMSKVAWLAANAVVHGGLNPETADAPALVRETWLTAIVKTLAHIRGEAHAS